MRSNQEGCDMLEHLLHYKINIVLLHPTLFMSKVNYALSASPNNQVSPTSIDNYFFCFYNKYTGVKGIFVLQWGGHHPVEAVKHRSSLQKAHLV